MPEANISIVIPVYNVRSEYLDECCKSLCTQTLPNAEYIFVFDGVQKELFNICNKYQQEDSRFKITSIPHSGVSSARNFGISQAAGQYILFVDADDHITEPTALAQIYGFCIITKCEVLLHSWAETEQTKIHNYLKDNIQALSPSQKEAILKNLLFCKNTDFSGAPWAKVFHRNFLLQNNIFFKDNCPIGQDRVFNYEALHKAKKISYLKEALYAYRISTTSSTQKFRANGLLDLLPYIEELQSLSSNKFPELIGRETLEMFYRSWDTCYMNKQNDAPFHSRMKQLLSIVKSERFQRLISNIDTYGLSNLAKIEASLLQKHLYFWIILHGIKHLY